MNLRSHDLRPLRWVSVFVLVLGCSVHALGFGHGTVGLPSTFTYPTGRVSQVVDREPHGLPHTLQQPSGKQTILTYDALSRPQTQTDGVGVITWNSEEAGASSLWLLHPDLHDYSALKPRSLSTLPIARGSQASK